MLEVIGMDRLVIRNESTKFLYVRTVQVKQDRKSRQFCSVTGDGTGLSMGPLKLFPIWNIFHALVVYVSEH